MLRTGRRATAAVRPSASDRVLPRPSHDANMKKLTPMLGEYVARRGDLGAGSTGEIAEPTPRCRQRLA